MINDSLYSSDNTRNEDDSNTIIKKEDDSNLPILAPQPPPPPGMWNMYDPTMGTYHPEFMFCGACTTCQEPNDDRQLTEDEQLETYDDDDADTNTDFGGKQEQQDTIFQNVDVLVLKTKFQLHRPITNPSHGLVVQSILRQLPGVTKVMISSPNADTILVDHDASFSTERVLQALESVGHSATLQRTPSAGDGRTGTGTGTASSSTNGTYSDNAVSQPSTSKNNNNDNTWVRSQFYVRGICCASEVPAIRKIVNPLPGVMKLQINITTKMVHVQHDTTIMTASQISRKLSKEGFPTKIQKDGGDAHRQLQVSHQHGRSTLQVHPGIDQKLSDADVTRIQSYLSHIPGVSRIGVNLGQSLVHIEHDIYTVSAAQCVQVLRPDYICDIQTAADAQVDNATAALLQDISKSPFVESTLGGIDDNVMEGEGSVAVSSWTSKQIKIIEKAVAQNFIRKQVRAIYPNPLSRTIKVEHDPKLVSIIDICGTIKSYGIPVQVQVNGADLKLYLPEQSTNNNTTGYGSFGDDDPASSLWKIHANVWLSGIFWALSMVSYRQGQDWFKYFGLASVAFGIPPIAVKAFRTVKRCQFDANCMMVTAAIGAMALGEYDEAASVAFLFAVSEFLEARATLKARKALSAIVNLRPDHANVVHPISKEIIVVPADRVPLGSFISVKTGDRIAADGIVVEGSTAIDESSLTGEAKPAHKKVGDTVSGGTINIGSSPLLVKTTTSVDDSAVARLIRLVEEAQSNRSPTEKMIDTFARSYTPSVMLLALLMCTIPWYWGTEVGRYWTLNGLIIIVIACPCALTISTPVTYAAGLAATAQRGIIVKGGAKLEAMGSVDRIVFDKTGTLTKGKFSVLHLEVVGTSKSREEMLELLALMQERSSHPLSTSLVEAAKKEGIKAPQHVLVTEHTILKGEGIMAQAGGKPVYVGNERLFNRLGMLNQLSINQRQLIKTWSDTGGTVGFIGTGDNGIIGMFCVTDMIRDEAKAVIQGFKDAHIDVMICTGDSNAAGHAVARQIGIPRGAVHSQLLPEDKLHFVGSLKRPQPKRFALCREKRYVLFCGDGVNDAPALAVADIGASMGEGAAMAMEMSDVTLMDSQLTKLSYVIKMGRRVLRTVKENICISLLAKVGVVAATFAGKMTLFLAIGADVGIMLVVTLNGMKLLPSKTVVDPNKFLEVTNLQRKRRSRGRQQNNKITSEEIMTYEDVELEMTSPTEVIGGGGTTITPTFDAKEAEIV